MADQDSDFKAAEGAEAGAPADNEYESRTGQKDHIPVVQDDAAIEDPIDGTAADSDAQLERDDAEAIDESNIIEDRTRGAVKDYQEPGDDEGLEES